MESGEFLEKLIVEGLEGFNLFSINFLEGYLFFHYDYDKLPDNYKTKLLSVLKDTEKVEKDYIFQLKELKLLSLEDIDSYVRILNDFISEFTVSKILGSDEEVPEREQEIINYYIKYAEMLSDYFSTKVSVEITNQFLKENKEQIEKSDEFKITDSCSFNVKTFSLNIGRIGSSLEELIDIELNEI